VCQGRADRISLNLNILFEQLSYTVNENHTYPLRSGLGDFEIRVYVLSLFADHTNSSVY